MSRTRVQHRLFRQRVGQPPRYRRLSMVDINVSVDETIWAHCWRAWVTLQSDGVILNASINQDNFAGTGKKVSLALKTSSANRHYQVSSTNPYYTIDGISRGIRSDLPNSRTSMNWIPPTGRPMTVSSG